MPGRRQDYVTRALFPKSQLILYGHDDDSDDGPTLAAVSPTALSETLFLLSFEDLSSTKADQAYYRQPTPLDPSANTLIRAQQRKCSQHRCRVPQMASAHST
jgi:hypothetical protein